MNLEQQQKIVVEALEDVKGHEIQIFNTQPLTSLFDRVVIASGTSNRQTRALANEVIRKAREYGLHIIAVEGESSGEWVLIDLGDIVVHCMQPAIRNYYQLEALWCVHPISLASVRQTPLPTMVTTDKSNQ